MEKIGGPSVKPYQPAGLWKELGMRDMDYVQGHGEDLYRRSLYTFWKRTIAPPMMMNFDAADREACVVRETRTNTPLQALEPDERCDVRGGGPLPRPAHDEGRRRDRRRRVCATDSGLLTGARRRQPRSTEVLLDRSALSSRLFPAHGPKSRRLSERRANRARSRRSTARELAAYASVASLMLNLDEAVTKE